MQRSFSDLEYAAKKKVTRRDRFLSEIEAVTLWLVPIEAIESFYPKGGGWSRALMGVERMLRMYIAQQCFGPSNEEIEDANYESQATRGFVGIDLAREAAPDGTTLLKFRRLLEAHQLTEGIFATINTHLAARGLLLREGTVVEATIIAAPSSTRNQSEGRDPEMHQTKKENEWHFGMKAHIGVDAHSGLVHTLGTTAANLNDVTQAHQLLHGEGAVAFGDAGYQGVEKREENQGSTVKLFIAMLPGKRRALPDTESGRLDERIGKLKAGIRAKVEYPFHFVKNLFGHRKNRYWGLAKNTAQLSRCSPSPIWWSPSGVCSRLMPKVSPEMGNPLTNWEIRLVFPPASGSISPTWGQTGGGEQIRGSGQQASSENRFVSECP